MIFRRRPAATIAARATIVDPFGQVLREWPRLSPHLAAAVALTGNRGR